MAQTSNGSITITDLTDITDVYLEYCMAADSITTAEDIIAKTIWTPPERGWSTEYPTWQSGYQIWIREVTKKEGITQLEHGTPFLDKAVNQINNNISNIQTKIKKIWSNSTGSYMASGINGNDVTENDVSTYGFNSKSTTTGVSFNYNAISLTSLGTDGLKLYSPVLTNSIITGNRLDATLTSEGLKLLRGGIEAGDKNTNNYIYVYSHDDPTDHTLAINNSGDKSDWRIIAGKNFGVDKAGTLYANEAHISGTFTVKAGSESNIYTKDESDEKVQEEVEKVISVKEASGNIVHVEDASEYPALELTATIVPKQSGTGTPSPDNVREISGWTEVETSVCGKNFYNPQDGSQIGVTFTVQNDGTVLITGTAIVTSWCFLSRYVDLPYNGISAGDNISVYSDAYLIVQCIDANNTVIRTIDSTNSRVSYDSVPANTVKLRLLQYPEAQTTEQGTTFNMIAHYYIGIDASGTFTTWTPCTATTHTTTLGRTVYGGTLDVVSGTLTVDSIIETFDAFGTQGDLASEYEYMNTVTELTDCVRCTFAAKASADMSNFNRASSSYDNPICSLLPHYFAYSSDTSHWYRNTVLYAYFPKSYGTTVADVSQTLYDMAQDGKPLQFILPLVTPQTYQLTPQQINTLAGVNNVWADSGDVYLKYATMNPDMQALMGNATGTKADKTAALSRSQRIYYRSTSIQNSLSGPTTWLSTSGTGYGNWSLSIPQLTNGEDSYPYLYTCVQNQTAAQYAAGSVCTCTPVVRDDSTTVIDGGSITTGVVSANYIDAAHLQIGKGQVDGLSEYMSFMTFENGVLKITKPGFNYSVEIRNDGVYIVDPNNHAIASYKDYITLGTKDGNNINIRSDSINFNIGNQTYAYVAQDKWFASNAEVSGAMYIDDYSLRQNANGDFVLGRRK